MYSDKDFEKIKNIILEEIEPYKIVLFGSYATGKQNEFSDIDILILLNEHLSRKGKLDIIYRIERRFLYLKYNVDIILKSKKQYEKYKYLIGTINYEIAKHGKVLWTKI